MTLFSNVLSLLYSIQDSINQITQKLKTGFFVNTVLLDFLFKIHCINNSCSMENILMSSQGVLGKIYIWQPELVCFFNISGFLRRLIFLRCKIMLTAETQTSSWYPPSSY